MAERIVLDQVGGLSQSARQYDYSAQDGSTAATDFIGRVDATEAGMIGRGGNRARSVGHQISGNTSAISANVSNEVAPGVRTAETQFVEGDDTAAAAYTSSAAEAEAQGSTLRKSIGA